MSLKGLKVFILVDDDVMTLDIAPLSMQCEPRGASLGIRRGNSSLKRGDIPKQPPSQLYCSHLVKSI